MRPKDNGPPIDIVPALSDGQLRDLHALYQNEWWTKNRTLEETRRCVEGSQVCLGLVDSSATLVGFARILTDFIVKAMIFDVIVAQAYRNQGLGDKLMALILNHEKLRSVKSFELYCLPELIPFYERHSFTDRLGSLRLMRRAVA